MKNSVVFKENPPYKKVWIMSPHFSAPRLSKKIVMFRHAHIPLKTFKVLKQLPNNYAFKFTNVSYDLPAFDMAAIDAAMIYTNDTYGVKIIEHEAVLNAVLYYVYDTKNNPLFMCDLHLNRHNSFVISELMKRGQNLIKARDAANDFHLSDMAEIDELAHIVNTVSLIADVNRYFNF